MNEQEKDDIFYVCCLIEFTARKTGTRKRDIANAIGEKEIERQLTNRI